MKKLEELGIGRPSTYAPTISTIQNRNYVEKDRGKHIPQERGRILTAFLNNFFGQYIEYDFTADLEKKLENNFSVDVLNDFNADTTNYNSDIHASAKYRGNLVKVLLEEAIAQLF